MTYRAPTDNIIIDGILHIPAYQQYETYFSFVVESSHDSIGGHRVIRLDNPKEISKNYLLTLRILAKVIGIKDSSKLKKADLVGLLRDRIVFD